MNLNFGIVYIIECIKDYNETGLLLIPCSLKINIIYIYIYNILKYLIYNTLIYLNITTVLKI